MKYQAKEAYRSELRNIDWDFTGEVGATGFSTYHWYPARYVPQLPGILINYFSAPGELILDPFCGSGTTLLEAFKFGRPAVGIDITPAAVLMTRAKTNSYDSESFSKYGTDIIAEIEDKIIQARSSSGFERALLQRIPNLEENSKWYHSTTLVELAAIWSAISERKESNYISVGQAAFSAILIYCCSQGKHWGWVCDNVRPEHLVPRNALRTFSYKLIEYELCMRDLLAQATDLQEKRISLSDIRVHEGDCIEVLKDYSEGTFDLVVSSPPYYNMTDYIKSQRLSNLWLGVDMKSLKKKEIGARYKRGRQGALTEYLDSMKMSMTEIARVLKPEKFCCVVLGESPQHEAYLRKFDELCITAGLEICDSISRTISSSRRFIPSIKQEKILIMRKR